MSKVLIVDDTDPSIVYNGDWLLMGPLTSTSHEFNGSIHRGDAIGSSLTYTFSGVGIELYGTLDTPATKGLAGVQFQVDDNPSEMINSSVTPLTYHLDQVTTHQILFQANNLNAGEHTVTIDITNTTTNGPYFYFDFFTVQTAQDSVAGHVILDDKDPSISYVPQWTNPGVPDEYLGGTSQSPSAGSFATVEFNGTEIYVYGTTDDNRAGGAAQIGFVLDGQQGPDFNAPDPNSTPIFHNLFFSKRDLANANHTLKIEVLSNRTWFLDYIVYTTTNSSVIGGKDLADAEKGGKKNKNRGGSRTGAVIGGVVVAITVLLVLAVIAFFVMRRRRRQRYQKGVESRFSVAPSPTHRSGPSPDMAQATSVTPYIVPTSSQPQSQYQNQSQYISVPPSKGGFANPSSHSIAYTRSGDGSSSVGDSSTGSAESNPRATSRTHLEIVSQAPISVTNQPTYISPTRPSTGTGTGTSIGRGSSYRRSEEKRRRRDTDASSPSASQFPPYTPTSSHSHSHSHSTSYTHSHSHSYSQSKSLPTVPVPPVPIEVDSGQRFRPLSTVPPVAPPEYTAN